jgi:glutathione S-transferase
MSIKLYCFGESGHSYKAALALELAGVDGSRCSSTSSTARHARRNIVAISTDGRAPVLVDGATTLSQSGAILDYMSSGPGVSAPLNSDRREVCAGCFGTPTSFSTVAGVARAS